VSKKREGFHSIGETQRTAPCPCLNCGKLLDSATGINDANAVAPGCITICFSCGHVMAFDDNLMFRELTDEEVIEVAGDPRLVEFSKLRARYK
jgi:DNA-directed RNA polymerase subunit N (RpoN/RPB10)